MQYLNMALRVGYTTDSLSYFWDRFFRLLLPHMPQFT